jgi:hypothetical protein
MVAGQGMISSIARPPDLTEYLKDFSRQDSAVLETA